MFRPLTFAAFLAWSFPRIRGNVPQLAEATTKAEMFSPHTRGCSEYSPRLIAYQYVFPAYAGMFRMPQAGEAEKRSFPRIRGDVPDVDVGAAPIQRFSPHTRGCSGRPGAGLTQK